MTPHSPDLIFDRASVGHSWARAFADLDRHAEQTHRIICKNWRMDHRVHETRESEMLASEHFTNVLDGEDWWAAQGQYFEHELSFSSTASVPDYKSAYVRPENSSNMIPQNQVARFDQLVHVASLNGILWRVSGEQKYAASLDADRFWEITGHDIEARRQGGYGSNAFDREIDDLAYTLKEKGPEAIKQVAGLLSDGLGDRQPPWWACFADEISGLIADSDWTGLCKALGMGHVKAGNWLFVWRYDISTAGRIYRPTVVEANDGPFHYPSPPGYSYGVTMRLDSSRHACREVVHAPLRGAAATENCIGLLGRIDDPIPSYDEIYFLRNKHKERLLREFPMMAKFGWIILK